MCTAIKCLSYTCVSIVLKTQVDTCVPWAWAYVFQDVEKALMSGLADLVLWGEFWEQFLMCSHRKREKGDKRLQTAKREREHGTVNHNMPCWHVLSLIWPLHPSLQPFSTISSVYSPPSRSRLAATFSFSVLTTAPTSREKRLTCIQQHLSGRKKWIKERRRPVDSQCLRCQEPKSLSANAWDCPRCRRGTKKEWKGNKYPPEIWHHMEKGCFQKSHGKICGAPLQWKRFSFDTQVTVLFVHSSYRKCLSWHKGWNWL